MVSPRRMSYGFDGNTDMHGSLYDALPPSSYRHLRHRQLSDRVQEMQDHWVQAAQTQNTIGLRSWTY